MHSTLGCGGGDCGRDALGSLQSLEASTGDQNQCQQRLSLGKEMIDNRC
jgi:hypothetical protein